MVIKVAEFLDSIAQYFFDRYQDMKSTFLTREESHDQISDDVYFLDW